MPIAMGRPRTVQANGRGRKVADPLNLYLASSLCALGHGLRSNGHGENDTEQESFEHVEHFNHLSALSQFSAASLSA
jgi:hypothetical protein